MSSSSFSAPEPRLGVLSWRAVRLIAGVLAFGTGVTVLLMAAFTPNLQHPLAPIVTGAAAVVLGVVIVPLLPWHHWPYRCVVGVVLAGFTLNAIDRSFAPTPAVFGATVMTIFIGKLTMRCAHPQRAVAMSVCVRTQITTDTDCGHTSMSCGSQLGGADLSSAASSGTPNRSCDQSCVFGVRPRTHPRVAHLGSRHVPRTLHAVGLDPFCRDARSSSLRRSNGHGPRSGNRLPEVLGQNGIASGDLVDGRARLGGQTRDGVRIQNVPTENRSGRVVPPPPQRGVHAVRPLSG